MSSSWERSHDIPFPPAWNGKIITSLHSLVWMFTLNCYNLSVTLNLCISFLTNQNCKTRMKRNLHVYIHARLCAWYHRNVIILQRFDELQQQDLPPFQTSHSSLRHYDFWNDTLYRPHYVPAHQGQYRAAIYKWRKLNKSTMTIIL